MYSLVSKLLTNPNVRSITRRLMSTIVNGREYGGKLKGCIDLCEYYLTIRDTNQKSVNKDMFRALIVDKRSEHIVDTTLEKYAKLRENNLFYTKDITVEDMKHIIFLCETESALNRHLRYLFVREFDVWRESESKALRRDERERRLEWEKSLKIGVFDRNGCLQYGCYKNTMFQRYYDNGVQKYSLNNLRNATLWGQKVVIDCSFDQSMADYEVGSAYRQMARIYSANRRSLSPFDLHFCNCCPDSRVIQKFKGAYSELEDKKLFCNINEESYLELFGDRRLIYLSPDAPKVMDKFDDNAVYIIGLIVDKTCILPFSAFKARIEGLECYKLPIHLFVKLKYGVRKALSIQGVFNILLELKQHNDWKRAFINSIQDHKLDLNDEDCDILKDKQSFKRRHTLTKTELLKC